MAMYLPLGMTVYLLGIDEDPEERADGQVVQPNTHDLAGELVFRHAHSEREEQHEQQQAQTQVGDRVLALVRHLQLPATRRTILVFFNLSFGLNFNTMFHFTAAA